jgi:hypothetical protein
LIARLDQGQSHLRAAFHAGHFYTGLKARACRCRPECLQHRIPVSPKETQRHRLSAQAANQYAILLTSLESGADSV